MKKLLSVLLVAVMVLGMAVVSNAAAFNPAAYDASFTDIGDQVAPGEAFYVAIDGLDGVGGITGVGDLRADVTYGEGGDLISKVELTTLENSDGVDVDVLKVTTKKFFVPVDGKDLDMTVRLVAKANGGVVVADTKLAVTKVAFAVTDVSDAATQGVTLNNAAPVVDFGTDKTVEKFTISFAGGNFQVKVVNQGKLNLLYNKDANKDVVLANQDADLDFIDFEADPEFDFTGTMYLDAGDAKYLYEIGEKNALTKIDAEINENGDFEFKTNKLGAYVMSDVELKAAASSSSSSGSASTTNPGTGSSDAIGVAVALAVVSLAAAGAVAFKKASK